MSRMSEYTVFMIESGTILCDQLIVNLLSYKTMKVEEPSDYKIVINLKLDYTFKALK